VRSWRQQLLNEGRSATVAAKSYRLLRAVLKTALKEDQLIAQNPCRIPSYDKETSTERSVATIRQVFALSQLVERRYAALLLLAAFTGLRWGEPVALRRSDLDLERGTVTISREVRRATRWTPSDGSTFEVDRRRARCCAAGDHRGRDEGPSG
jgi:integrase